MDRNKLLPLAVVIGTDYLLSQFMQTAAPARAQAGVRRKERAEIEPIEDYKIFRDPRPRAMAGWDVKIQGTDRGGVETKEPDRDVDKRTERKIVRPQKVNVTGYNDDYTTQFFVRDAVQKYFKRAFNDAHGVMMQIHEKGSAVLNSEPLPKDVAEIRVGEVRKAAKEAGHPFLVEITPL